MVCCSSLFHVRHEVIEVEYVPRRHCGLNSRIPSSGGRRDIVVRCSCNSLNVYYIPTAIVYVIEIYLPLSLFPLDLSLKALDA